MCTLTIIPLPHPRAGALGFRLVTNRDEARSRPPAAPPAIHRAGDAQACWPTDALAGGTWVGASRHGLALSLLNGNPRPMPPLPPGLTSRGALIPALIDAPDADAALARLGSLDLDRLAPFRLVAVDFAGILDAQWTRNALDIARRPLAPACFASSGLGDHLAQARLPLWEERLARSGPTPAMQDDFHRHQWPLRPEVSVRMSRPGARTVSTTTVEVATDSRDAVRVTMRYTADSGSVSVRLSPGERRALASRAG